jgi:N-succinyl-L-ornithine transcarbamylase
MRQFISVNDVSDPVALAREGLELKSHPFDYKDLGRNKCLGLVFVNPSLRTRMSSQRAAQNLGLDIMVLNIDQEGWALELRDGVIMNGTKVEHIREAAAIMGEYCDILGIRSFAELKSKEQDYKQEMLNGLIQYSGVPVISLESALFHPLQSLADLMTILEQMDKFPGIGNKKPKITLLWAPHIKALPQAVPNSFAEWILKSGFDLTIGAPEGMDLDQSFTRGANWTHSKTEAIQNADFIYVKNWSSFSHYGSIGKDFNNWMLDLEDLKSLKPNLKIMHCLPVRRDLELHSSILDSPYSLVKDQARNRIYSAQVVLKSILQSEA